MGAEYPEHPRPSCHALVMRGREVLLVRRAAEPLRGYWGLPGGAVELGETVVEALRREVREETGLEIEPVRYLGYRDAISRDATGRVRFHYVVLFYSAQLVSGEVSAGDDAEQATWVPIDHLADFQVTESVEECLRWAGVMGEESGWKD